MTQPFDGVDIMGRTYVITEDGLQSYTKDKLVLAMPSDVLLGMFGEQWPTNYRTSAMMRFMSALKKLGVIVTEYHTESARAFEVWFDISSKRNRAYYNVFSIVRSKEAVWKLYTMFCWQDLDFDIVKSIRLADIALCGVAQKCGLTRVKKELWYP